MQRCNRLSTCMGTARDPLAIGHINSLCLTHSMHKWIKPMHMHGRACMAEKPQCEGYVLMLDMLLVSL